MWIFRKRNIKDYLGKLSRSKKVNFRIYGHLDEVEEKLFNKYHSHLDGIISSYKGIDLRDISIYFRRRNEHIECEVKFITKSTLDSVMVKNENLTQKLEAFKKVLSENNSDLILKTAFASSGEPSSSGFQFIF